MQNCPEFFHFAFRAASSLGCAGLLVGCQIASNAPAEITPIPEAQTVALDDQWQKLYVNAQELLDSGQTSVAIKLLKLSAENDNISAHYALSELYQRNLVPIEADGIDSQNLRLFHLRFAAEGGLPKAQAKLARLYATGAGVRKSPELAVRYYSSASAAGIAEAQYGLGQISADPSGN